MIDTVAPTMTFHHEFQQPPQATVSLSETSLDGYSRASMTPCESVCIKDENDNEIDEEGAEKRPSKKRKSWGQELPVPKTNLPPRKRAKTEDEKEQRRIERVLRNRAAAQSSRERKRQEVEKLEGEKATIEQHNQYLKDRLMAAEHEKFLLSQQVKRMEAQMKSMKGGSSADLSDHDSPEPEAKTFDERKIKQEIDDYATSLVSPETYSSPSSMTYSASQSPTQPSLTFDEESLATSPDMTQHPAAMFCDPIIFGESGLEGDDFDLGSLFPADDTLSRDPLYHKQQPSADILPFSTLIPAPDGSDHTFDDSSSSPQTINTDFSTPFMGGNEFTFDSMVDFDAVPDSHAHASPFFDDFNDDSNPSGNSSSGSNDSASSSTSPAQLLAES